VRRGNETWARTVAEALVAQGQALTLFGGGPLSPRSPYERLACVERETRLLRGWVSWHHRYLIEQRTFSWSLRSRLRRGDVDVLHLADPLLAELMRRQATRLGIAVSYKDGQLLGPEWCSRFEWIQVLAPFYRDDAARRGFDVSKWFVIPHLVDTETFQPGGPKAAIRRALFGESIPGDAFVVLAVGDFAPGSNKRLEWIMGEVAAVRANLSLHCIIAGQTDSASLRAFEARAREALGDRVHLRPNVPSEHMASLYQAADVLAHGALKEPFGIIFLEAMACGLPILAHQFEVTRWIIGDAGETLDMERDGELAARLALWQGSPVTVRDLSSRARQRATTVFDRRAIAPRYVEMQSAMRASLRGAAARQS
jgi:glycosyltransferase involved in cell wall biosynthesis